MKLPQSKIKFEFIAFLEFVEKATGWQREKTPDTFYSENGIVGLTEEPTKIFIKSYGDCCWHYAKINKHKTAFICLGDREDSEKNTSPEGQIKRSILYLLALYYSHHLFLP